MTRLVGAVVMVAVAIVLAGLGIWMRVEADGRRAEADRVTSDANRLTGEVRQLTDDVDTANSALTDAAATSQMTGQLSNAIKETFSYSYADLAATERAVDEHLTGQARCVHDQLFGKVKEFAPEQKIVLATTVREIALVRLEGDRAEALVYIDQSSTRTDTNKTVAAGGQFTITAQRQGDKWKITEFDFFDQPLPNGEPAPKC